MLNGSTCKKPVDLTTASLPVSSHHSCITCIMYCEAASNYTRFYTAEGKQFLRSKTVSEYEDLLIAHHFIRSHKSFLLAKDFVAYVDHDGLLVLKNGVRLDVSKKRKADVMRLMKT